MGESTRSLVMKKWWVILFGLLSVSFLMRADDRVWDQKKAVSMAKEMIELEKKGQPWDQIKWMTDTEKASERMKKEGKPALVYFYIDKGGPKAAPC